MGRENWHQKNDERQMASSSSLRHDREMVKINKMHSSRASGKERERGGEKAISSGRRNKEVNE